MAVQILVPGVHRDHVQGFHDSQEPGIKIAVKISQSQNPQQSFCQSGDNLGTTDKTLTRRCRRILSRPSVPKLALGIVKVPEIG